jgi:dihydrofolate synthase / folylpolyglutamate synthase
MVSKPYMQETLDYLYNLTRFGMKPGLEIVVPLLEFLGNPQGAFKSIHVAGTNGKGSTCAFISSILREAGYKVGVYTSPHLVNFNERIRINGKEISDEELANYTMLLKDKSEEINLQPTFFEFTTAIAFLHFKNEKVDYAVIETGMGGRLDATNVLTPVVCVITNISFDHTKYLGNTILEIAREKAAIIKENGLVVTAETDVDILHFFDDVCLKKRAKLFVVGECEFKTNLLGEYQRKNAAMAMKVGELLNINNKIIEEGLFNTKWSGRLEYISENVLVDCAHNVAGMKTLRDYVKTLSKRIILIFGTSEDKEIDEMVSLIVPLVDEVILTKSNFKPASLDLLEASVRRFTNKITKCEKVSDAILEASKKFDKENLILVAGSIYLVGDVLKQKALFRKLYK